MENKEINLSIVLKGILNSFKKYKFFLLLVIIASTLIGFYSHSKKETFYKYNSVILYNSIIIEQPILISLFSTLNVEIKGGKTQYVSTIFNISEEAASSVKSILIENIPAGPLLTTKNKSFIIHLTTNSKQYSEEIEQGIIFLLNNNHPFQEKINLKKNQLKNKISSINDNIEKLNTDSDALRKDPITNLINLKLILYEEKSEFEFELKTLNQGFSYLKTMNHKSPIAEVPNLNLHLTLGALIGFILSISFLFSIEFIRLIR